VTLILPRNAVRVTLYHITISSSTFFRDQLFRGEFDVWTYRRSRGTRRSGARQSFALDSLRCEQEQGVLQRLR
ncbi:unnamed protein product, partial [Nippostrongylus brasiliensis]|uniref:Ovule protein n=1 Tax=Nippostrongylus brasiliensis TaxID=27835 RepID=A0A0N4XQS9_NIPBR